MLDSNWVSFDSELKPAEVVELPPECAVEFVDPFGETAVVVVLDEPAEFPELHAASTRPVTAIIGITATSLREASLREAGWHVLSPI
jgi:hypothetical protein